MTSNNPPLNENRGNDPLIISETLEEGEIARNSGVRREEVNEGNMSNQVLGTDCGNVNVDAEPEGNQNVSVNGNVTVPTDTIKDRIVGFDGESQEDGDTEKTREEEGFFDNSDGLVSLFNDEHKQSHPLDLEMVPLYIDQGFSLSAYHVLSEISPSYLSSPFMLEKNSHTLYRRKSMGNDIPLPTFDSEEEEEEEDRPVAILFSLEESQPCEVGSQCDLRREAPFMTRSDRLVKRPKKSPW